MQLAKEQKINLVKENSTEIETLRFGINWGMIKSGGFFGIGGSKKSVDLDAAAFCFNKDGSLVSSCFTNLLGGKLNIGYLLHSGDDLRGDSDSDSNDNETISAFISKIPENVTSVIFTVNSFSGDPFDKIPFVGIRIYEGPVNNPTKIHAAFNLEHDATFAHNICAVIGKLYRRNNGAWNFMAIGECFNSRGITNITAAASRYAV